MRLSDSWAKKLLGKIFVALAYCRLVIHPKEKKISKMNLKMEGEKGEKENSTNFL